MRSARATRALRRSFSIGATRPAPGFTCAQPIHVLDWDAERRRLVPVRRARPHAPHDRRIQVQHRDRRRTSDRRIDGRGRVRGGQRHGHARQSGTLVQAGDRASRSGGARASRNSATRTGTGGCESARLRHLCRKCSRRARWRISRGADEAAMQIYAPSMRGAVAKNRHLFSAATIVPFCWPKVRRAAPSR